VQAACCSTRARGWSCTTRCCPAGWPCAGARRGRRRRRQQQVAGASGRRRSWAPATWWAARRTSRSGAAARCASASASCWRCPWYVGAALRPSCAGACAACLAVWPWCVGGWVGCLPWRRYHQYSSDGLLGATACHAAAPLCPACRCRTSGWWRRGRASSSRPCAASSAACPGSGAGPPGSPTGQQPTAIQRRRRRARSLCSRRSRSRSSSSMGVGHRQQRLQHQQHQRHQQRQAACS
jgi:hypothetical protein